MGTTVRIDEQVGGRSAGACPVCGFEPTSLDAEQAAAVVRSLPLRFTEVLASVAARDDDELSRRLPTDGWSALEHVGHVRDVLHALDVRMQRVQREDRPVIPATPQTPPGGANDQGPGVVLACLRHNAGNLAGTLAGLGGRDWHRTGVRLGGEVTALDLAREAVHTGLHHLALVERGLTELAEGRPVS